MRTELENIQKIEQYLEGKLEGIALEQFEAELAVNQELRIEVDLQRQIIRRLNYLAAKEDLNVIHEQMYPNTPISVWKSYFSNTYALLAGVAILIISSLLWWNSGKMGKEGEPTTLPTGESFANSSTSTLATGESFANSSTSTLATGESFANSSTSTLPTGESFANGSNYSTLATGESFANSSPKQHFFASKVVDILYPNKEKKDRQVFKIQSHSDTVIIGKKGTKILIPSEVFIRGNGEMVDNSLVNIELIELYDLNDYIKYDLPTISNQKMLESGGVIYLNATLGNEKLAIAKGKGLHVQFNSQHAKKDRMQAFYLERENDKPNWEAEGNPMRLTGNLLERSDVKKMKARNNLKSNQKLSIDNQINSRNDMRPNSLRDTLFNYWVYPTQKAKKTIAVPQEVLRYNEYYKGLVFKGREDIFNRFFEKISSQQYAHTFIATVPFRERLEGMLLHENERAENGKIATESELLLDIYLKNVDKPLWFADSLVVNKLNDWGAKCELYNPRVTLFRWLRSQNYTVVVVPADEDKLNGLSYGAGRNQVIKSLSSKYNVTYAEWDKSYMFLLHKKVFRRGYRRFLRHYYPKNYVYQPHQHDQRFTLVRIAVSGIGHWGFEYAAYHGTLKPNVIQVKRPCRGITDKYANVIDEVTAYNQTTNFARVSASNSGAIDQNSVSSTFVTRLGWVNCDRFYQLREQNSADLQIALVLPETPALSPQVYLVFKRINAVLPIYLQNGKYISTRLPKGEEISIVALWHNGEKIFYQKQNLILQKNNYLTITLQSTEKESEVREMLVKVR
jgi:hypothetical protein